MEVTFEEWLATREEDNGPVGDLARDVRDDPHWVKAGPETQMAYMSALGAIPEAIDAYRLARSLYEERIDG